MKVENVKQKAESLQLLATTKNILSKAMQPVAE